MLVRLTVPLYKTGEDYAKTRAAQQTSAQKRLELDDARNKAREQASNAWRSLVTAQETKSTRQEVVAAENDALAGVILPIDAIDNFSFVTAGSTEIGRNSGGTAVVEGIGDHGRPVSALPGSLPPPSISCLSLAAS